MENQIEYSKKNVKAIVEMTRMIEVSRQYTQVADLLQKHGDTRRSAIERLAEVPASHLSNLEAPAAFDDALAAFLAMGA